MEKLFMFENLNKTLYVEVKPRSVDLSWRLDYEDGVEDAFGLSYDSGELGTEHIKRAVSVQLSQSSEKDLLKKILDFGLFKDLHGYIKQFM